MEIGGLLQAVGGVEQAAFLKVIADQLQPHGHAALAKAGGHAHAGQACQRCRQGEDVSQVVGQRVVAVLAQLPGHGGGHRAKHYTDLVDMYKKTRAEGFGDEVKRRIMIGTYVLSHGYYDAYYLQAQKIRRLIADDFQNAFQSCDVIAGPVAPTVAWKLGEHGNDPLADYLADIFTLPASLAGLPGMSVPAGFGEGGMPVGLQLIGNYFAEARLLNAAHRLQQATDFHLRQPGGL